MSRRWSSSAARVCTVNFTVALTHGPDPLHLAQVFGLDEKTAMRCAASARALSEHAAEQKHQ